MAAEASAMSYAVFILVNYSARSQPCELLEPGVGGHEQPACGEADRAVEDVEIAGRKVGLVAQRPERLRVHPGGIARAGHVPHRDDVVDPVDAMEQVVELPQPAAQILRLHRPLDGRQHAVHVLVVGVLARALLEPDPELAARGDEGDRQVAVDVRAHPGQRELERCDPACRARLDERRPGAGHGGRVGPRGIERTEEEAGEDDVEVREELRILKDEAAELLLDALGHRQIEVREAGDSIGVGQRCHLGLHARDDLGDRRRRRHESTIRGLRPPCGGVILRPALRLSTGKVGGWHVAG